jgi:hypothetical protein
MILLVWTGGVGTAYVKDQKPVSETIARSYRRYFGTVASNRHVSRRPDADPDQQSGPNQDQSVIDLLPPPVALLDRGGAAKESIDGEGP